jgi:hypothetical protein
MAYEKEAKALTQAIINLMNAAAGGAAAEEDEEEEEAPPAKPARGRGRPAAKPAAKETPAAKPARGRGKAKPAGPTIVDVRDALRKVSHNEELGTKKAKGLLAEFDVKNVNDLEEEDYAEFIEACNEMLAEVGDDEEDDDDGL